MINIDAYGRILHVGDIVSFISHPSNDPELKTGMILSIGPGEQWKDGLIEVRPNPKTFKKPSKARKVFLRNGYVCNRTFEKDLGRYFDYADREIREAIESYEKETGTKWYGREIEPEQVRYWPRVIRVVSYERVSDPSIYID